MRTLPVCLATGFMISAAPAVTLIDLNFTGTTTAVQRQIFNDAASYWNSAITGFRLDFAWGSGVEISEAARSLTIDVDIPYIDGVGAILGQAGPLTGSAFQDRSSAPTEKLLYVSTGLMQFDSADVGAMIADNSFYGVVLHEMAHVLGFGTLWEPISVFDPVVVFDQVEYGTLPGEYYGTNALSHWNTEFGRTDSFVPVELGGGSGTANSHWNEVDGGNGNTGILSTESFDSNGDPMDFKNELMTGWASSSFFVSTATLGSLEDLGYFVDYSKAGTIHYVSAIPEPANYIGLGVLLASSVLLRRRQNWA